MLLLYSIHDTSYTVTTHNSTKYVNMKKTFHFLIFSGVINVYDAENNLCIFSGCLFRSWKMYISGILSVFRIFLYIRIS